MPQDIVLGDKTPGARTFTNTDNVTVKSDTDSPDPVDKFVDAKMDVSNAPLKSNVHPLEQHFAPSKPRHPYGKGVPPEDMKISEN